MSATLVAYSGAQYLEAMKEGVVALAKDVHDAPPQDA